MNFGVGMYSGLLPKGLTEEDLSSDPEEDERGANTEEKKKVSTEGLSCSLLDEDHDSSCLPGISTETWKVCIKYS